jgi:hypothetical protein
VNGGGITILIVLGLSILFWLIGKLGELAAEAQRRAETEQGNKPAQDVRALERLLREAGARERAKARPAPTPPPVYRAPPPSRPEPPPRGLLAVEDDEHGGRLDGHHLGTAVDPHVGEKLRTRHVRVHGATIDERHLTTRVGAFAAAEPSARQTPIDRIDRLPPLVRAVVWSEVLAPLGRPSALVARRAPDPRA